MSASIVELSGVRHHLGRRAALDGVDLRAHGGIVTLLGPNGAGKTTLLRSIATVIAPDEGTVTIDGLDPRRESERIEARRRLGYLPQQIGFTRSAMVFDALDHLAVLKEFCDDRARRRLVVDTLERVGLRERMTEPVDALSGGMQRRLGLAHALLGSPSLLVLDEPSAGLDPDERQRLRMLIAERRHAATIVVSTHLTDEAALGDIVMVLDRGRIVFRGTPAALAQSARGRTWVQVDFPPPDVRASWRLADGRHRCLGTPHGDVELVEPTVEDGYLLLSAAT